MQLVFGQIVLGDEAMHLQHGILDFAFHISVTDHRRCIAGQFVHAAKKHRDHIQLCPCSPHQIAQRPPDQIGIGADEIENQFNAFGHATFS